MQSKNIIVSMRVVIAIFIVTITHTLTTHFTLSVADGIEAATAIMECWRQS